MPTSPTAEYDVDDLPEEENDTDSQEMWEDIGWDDSFAAQLASGTFTSTAKLAEFVRGLTATGDSLEG